MREETVRRERQNEIAREQPPLGAAAQRQQQWDGFANLGVGDEKAGNGMNHSIVAQQGSAMDGRKLNLLELFGKSGGAQTHTPPLGESFVRAQQPSNTQANGLMDMLRRGQQGRGSMI